MFNSVGNGGKILDVFQKTDGPKAELIAGGKPAESEFQRGIGNHLDNHFNDLPES